MRTLGFFGKTNHGLFLLDVVELTGKTPLELGEYAEKDPEGYAFLEAAVSERNRRYNAAMKKK